MLFAFGLGDKVIAVGDYDRFPPEVENYLLVPGPRLNLAARRFAEIIQRIR